MHRFVLEVDTALLPATRGMTWVVIVRNGYKWETNGRRIVTPCLADEEHSLDS
jgi:hypothetical protein